MVVTLVRTANLQKQHSIHLDEVKKSQRAFLNKALLEKKTTEDQVATLNKSLGEAKTARDEVVTAFESIKNLSRRGLVGWLKRKLRETEG